MPNTIGPQFIGAPPTPGLGIAPETYAPEHIANICIGRMEQLKGMADEHDHALAVHQAQRAQALEEFAILERVFSAINNTPPPSYGATRDVYQLSMTAQQEAELQKMLAEQARADDPR
jgi:hypothetical protein